MCFGVGSFGCGSGRVHVVAPPRRLFLVVRFAFFPRVGWGGAVFVQWVRLLVWWLGSLCAALLLRVYGGVVVV